MVLDRSPHQGSPGNQDWMAWSGILLCVALASRLSPGSAWLALPLNLAFWTLLVVWARSSGAAGGVVALGWLLPVYYLTFRFSRGLVETMDVVLDTDGARYLEEAAELALITVAALTISLENGYLAIVLMAAVPWILRGRERRKVLRAAAAYAGLVLLVFAIVVAVAAHGRAADFYSTWGDENFASAATGLPTHLQHFASNYVRFDEGLSPKGILVTGFRVFVMSIRAQAGIPIETYTWEPTRDLLLRPANVAYLAILSTLVLMAARGWRSIVRQRDEQRLFLGFVLGVVVVLRQAAVTLLAPRESLLFAPPTHAALWLLVGMGLAGLLTRGRLRVASTTLLAALAIVVIVSNLAWLIAAGS